MPTRAVTVVGAEGVPKETYAPPGPAEVSPYVPSALKSWSNSIAK
jgi:hypothetical protein